MTIKNRALWNKVSVTQPSATKAYKGAGGFAGTAINFASVIHKATEVFGPVGIGWGYEIVEERFDTGGPIMQPCPELGRDIEVARYMTHTTRLKLWVLIDEQRAEVEHYGHTPYVYTNKFGIQSEMEASKKSLTDAIKKCLSMFGFNADIYLGLYDDYQYVEHMKEQEQIATADDKADIVLEHEKDYLDWKDKTMNLITSSVNMNELQALYKNAVRKAHLRADENYIKQIEKAKDKRKGDLSQLTEDRVK